MDSDNWIMLIAGLLIGGFAVYAYTKRISAPILSAGANATTKVIAENAETIEWKDYKGVDRKIILHREVRA